MDITISFIKIHGDYKDLVDCVEKNKVNLKGADLTGADLRWADLKGAQLTDADLTDADLRWANLTDANLTDANLAGAIDAPPIMITDGGAEKSVNQRRR